MRQQAYTIPPKCNASIVAKWLAVTICIGCESVHTTVALPKSGALPATITESQSPRPPQGGWGKHNLVQYISRYKTFCYISNVVIIWPLQNYCQEREKRYKRKEKIHSRYKTHLTNPRYKRFAI